MSWLDFGGKTCPSCGEIHYSRMEKAYMRMFGHCYEEDYFDWAKNKITLSDLESRKNRALHKI